MDRDARIHPGGDECTVADPALACGPVDRNAEKGRKQALFYARLCTMSSL